jgi:nitroreductase
MSYAIPKNSDICIEPLGDGGGVAAALRSRRSIRAYRSEVPPLKTVDAILDAARWSPSGSNMQPWKVIAVSGEARDTVCRLAQVAIASGRAAEADAYPVYPLYLREAYRARRSHAAEQRYAAMGIARGDAVAREAAVMRNYDFFGAPIGLFFVTGRELGHSQWAHLGMFIQSVALAAWELGLGTCIQEAWAEVRETLHRHFALPEDDVIYCGMALGYADLDAPVNHCLPRREAVEDFATFMGFAR